MKNLSSEMTAHLAGEVSSLCSCWRIVRGDGAELCLTDHDRDLEFEGRVYLASDGYNRSSLKSSNALNTDETEILGVISTEFLSHEDLTKGLYDQAQIFFFLVNWQDLDMGSIELRSGWIGEVRWQEGQFSAELRGLSDALRRTVGRVITPGCSADLGDQNCALLVEPLLQTISVDAVLSDHQLEISGFVDAGLPMTGGLLRFTSGANEARAFEVVAFDALSNVVTLFNRPADAVEIGDEAAFYPGCDKRFSTCRDVYSNAVNFQGFPHVPGLDALLEPGNG
jgi:uncharacterized phage protein (TIGR02218 family)